MSKISAYNPIIVVESNDLLVTVDVNDTSMAPTGTTKKMTLGQLYGSLPWQFNVINFGAVGNGRVVVDGAMSSSSSTTTLTCSTSTPFTAGDVGKHIIVNGAGAVTGESLVTTIASFVSSSVVILSASAGVTVSGATVSYGSDDTVAFQLAINAATAYAQANALYAEVLIPPAPVMFYMIAGALVTGSPTFGNSQLTLPVIATSAGKVTLVIKGTEDAAALAHWQQPYPLLSGSNIISTGVFANSTAQGNSINANGNPCIIGGPAQPAGFGTTGTVYSNMCIVLKGIRLIVPFSLNGYAYCGFDFSGVAAARLADGGCDSTATYDSEWQSHNMGAAGFNFGGLMPANSNNDRCPINEWSIGGGYVYGMMLTEHCNSERIRVLYCWTALAVSGSYWSSTGVHAVHIGQLSTEQCTNTLKIFGAGNGGVGPYIDIGQVDWEGANTFNLIDDGSNGLADARGTLKVTGDVPTGVTLNGSAQSASNQTGLKIIFSANPPGPVASPTSAPASGSPWSNPYWHDAWITLSATTITAVTIDSTSQSVPSGAATYTFLLPSGHSYTPTYTGTLTHTVTLL